MTYFIRKILIFSFIIIIAAILGEILVRHLPNTYSYKSSYMDRNAGEIETLILGSSHTYYGVMPELLQGKSFNLANISQTPDYDMALLQKYIGKMHNLSTVIMPVSYFSFREPALDRGEGWPLASKYQIYMGIRRHPSISVYNFEIFNFSGFSGTVRNIFLHQPQNTCDSLGFGLGFDIGSRQPTWENMGLQRAASNTFPASGRVKEVEGIYESIIDLCQEKGINVILVATPVWHTFMQNVDQGQLKEMDSLANTLALNRRVTFVNLMNDSEFTDLDFHDTDHLSPQGAEKLSQILTDIIKRTN